MFVAQNKLQLVRSVAPCPPCPPALFCTRGSALDTTQAQALATSVPSVCPAEAYSSEGHTDLPQPPSRLVRTFAARAPR